MYLHLLESIADSLKRIADSLDKPKVDVKMNPDDRIENLCYLSRRVKNACQEREIHTVKELSGWTRTAMMSQHNVGSATYNELDRLLNRYGLHWGMFKSASYKRYGGGR